MEKIVPHPGETKIYLGCVALESENEEEMKKNPPLLQIFKKRFFSKNTG